MRAVFIDRDGVVNRKAAAGCYVTDVACWEMLPGVGQAVATLNNTGFAVLVVTNQRGLARGLMSWADLEAIHALMLQQMQACGARITAVYVCPHDYSDRCGCRKPNAGMLLAAAADHSIDLTASWMVGDSVNDIIAGKRAGCRTALVGDAGTAFPEDATLIANDLQDAVEQIVNWEANAGRHATASDTHRPA